MTTLLAPMQHTMAPGESNTIPYQLLFLCGENAIGASNLICTPNYAVPGRACLRGVMQPVREQQA